MAIDTCVININMKGGLANCGQVMHLLWGGSGQQRNAWIWRALPEEVGTMDILNSEWIYRSLSSIQDKAIKVTKVTALKTLCRFRNQFCDLNGNDRFSGLLTSLNLFSWAICFNEPSIQIQISTTLLCPKCTVFVSPSVDPTIKSLCRPVPLPLPLHWATKICKICKICNICKTWSL